MTSSSGLTDREIQIISFIEQCFYQKGALPSNEFVAEMLGIMKAHVEKAWKKDLFRETLKKRNIPIDNKQHSSVLLPMQIMLAQMLLNSHDKKSIREKLELLDITSQTYHSWMRQPAFTDYLRTLAEKHFAGADATAYMALISNVEKGDPASIKLFFEMRSIYNPKVEVNVNVEALFARIVEVIVKYVDPSVLPAIADELEGIMSGTAPVQKLPAFIPVEEVKPNPFDVDSMASFGV